MSLHIWNDKLCLFSLFMCYITHIVFWCYNSPISVCIGKQSRFKIPFSLTNSRFNELFSVSLWCSLKRDSTIFFYHHLYFLHVTFTLYEQGTSKTFFRLFSRFPVTVASILPPEYNARLKIFAISFGIWPTIKSFFTIFMA